VYSSWNSLVESAEYHDRIERQIERSRARYEAECEAADEYVDDESLGGEE